jgi:hypothetical protein
LCYVTHVSIFVSAHIFSKVKSTLFLLAVPNKEKWYPFQATFCTHFTFLLSHKRFKLLKNNSSLTLHFLLLSQVSNNSYKKLPFLTNQLSLHEKLKQLSHEVFWNFASNPNLQDLIS